MKVNKNLSVVIPTYNRADFLNYSLEVHIPMLKEHNIPLYISDNASTDHTSKVVSNWMKEYKFLYYSKNETNIGTDANFEKALMIPDSEYVWLLGDTYKIPRDSIEYLLKTILNEFSIYDMFILNLANKLNIESQIYTNENKLLNELGAIMSCSAINIYKKNLINNADFKRYFKTNFIQTGIIFEYISNKKFQVKWLKEHSITSLSNEKLKKTNWSSSSKAFEIACKDWSNLVMSFPPSYKLENKMKCIMDFGKANASGVFTIKGLAFLRSKGLLNSVTLKKYKIFFPLTINYSFFIIFLISIFPKSLIRLVYTIKNNLKKLIKKVN